MTGITDIFELLPRGQNSEFRLSLRQPDSIDVADPERKSSLCTNWVSQRLRRSQSTRIIVKCYLSCLKNRFHFWSQSYFALACSELKNEYARVFLAQAFRADDKVSRKRVMNSITCLKRFLKTAGDAKKKLRQQWRHWRKHQIVSMVSAEKAPKSFSCLPSCIE